MAVRKAVRPRKKEDHAPSRRVAGWAAEPRPRPAPNGLIGEKSRADLATAVQHDRSGTWTRESCVTNRTEPFRSSRKARRTRL